MREVNDPYRAVYHFRDDRLLEVFLSAIPRSQLVGPLRNNESLRNRCFRGFRISDTAPTRQQILSAYKREIIDHSNGSLATSLCAEWIRAHQSLADVALAFLGIATEHAADAGAWIGDVHRELKEDGQERACSLARALARQFSDDDILIFISVIGYDLDQQTLRHLVEQELQCVTKDPVLARERIDGKLESVKAVIEGLDRSLSDCEGQFASDKAQAHGVLEGMSQRRDALAADLAKEETLTLALTQQLADLEVALHQRQGARAAVRDEQERLCKSIERHRNHMDTARLAYEKRHSEIEGTLREQNARFKELAGELEHLTKRLDIDERKEAARLPAEPAILGSGTAAKAPGLVGNDAICYQGLQRTFRNSVVAFLRDRLPHLYPLDHLERVKRLFPEEWARTEQNANRSREIYGTTTAIRDDYDLLGINHFYGLFEKLYDQLFSSEAGRPANVVKPTKARLLGNLKAIKDGRDPLSHPVEEEVPYEEAYHLLISAKQVLIWLGCDAPATELSALAGQLDGGQAEEPSVLRRLPSEDSICLEFVGRDNLLKELGECFLNPDNRRYVIAGDGGKGKSAAAYRFAQGLSRTPGRFQLIVWLSAKRRRFREGVTAAVESPDFASAGEAINRLLGEYGATLQDLDKPLPERKQLLFQYLNSFPAFLIADDIDTLLEDDDVVSLFTHEIPQTFSAVLLTSRRAIPGVRSFVLQGMNGTEAEQFISSRVRLYNLGAASFTPAKIKEIARITDGSPLYMDDLMRLAGIVDIEGAIRMWADKKGDEARKYALERELEKLSPDGRKVLIAAAVADEPISFAELEGVLNFSEDRLLSALAELHTLFLLPKASVVEGEQRYQINLNTKKLVRLVEGPKDLYARIESTSKALAGKLPSVGHGVVGSLIRQALLRLNSGQHADAEAILNKAIEKYPNEPDLRGVLGYVFKRIGRIADAREQFEGAFKVKAKNRDMYLHWIGMEMTEKEWSKAISVADRALKVLPNDYEIVERKVYAMRQAGFDFYSGLHREKASKMWADAAEEIRRNIKPPEALSEGARKLNASMYLTMVVCLDMLGHLGDRDRWIDDWEKEHPDDSRVGRQKAFIVQKRGSARAGGS